ncbi:nucleotidyltransferase [Pseudalkalibacillus salsuginis]|uniref:nucleotidyltransferase n=1 Tax=Pseudalkalibacillus salsuginis TaxID=2910972 RepID=UPI001F285445|nr:nucleotidyltransferase [Pseudalkalibacillus salsuginis]MCF6410450.1 nucleotidyltransferase [Pseudalkalibacillus salsuginis]
MKTLGLIVEYNPFHNGHLYHLQQSKKQSQADTVIAVMSGNFLQRGEPALVSKWTRAKMALEAGVDLIVELPYAFATQRADRFAFGAVSILDALKCDEIIFGSESGKIEPFMNTVDFLNENQKEYNDWIQKHVQTGVSYPTAASMAFSELQGRPQESVDLTKPNNILGYHYVNSICQIGSTMNIDTIQRTGAGYHDEEHGTDKIASATGIRKILFGDKGSLSGIKDLVPPTTFNGLGQHQQIFGTFISWERYFNFLKHRLITSSPEELSQVYECVEGIENRLMNQILRSESFSGFLEDVKTKRYTWTRLQRLCTHLLTNAKKETMDKALTVQPTYIRLLGMNQKGQLYLNANKKKVELPIVSTLSKHTDDFLQLDIIATNTYILGFPVEHHSRLWRQEYSNPPIRV